MNVILLSGGGGKRLWPLSNDIRSKQFVRLFNDKNGNYESMVQRAYRQIISVDKNAQIVIATGKPQVELIKNQLGSKVSVCVEPCRKDTFPAIALAAAYLKDKKGVSEEDSVVVCPVDPYVDETYYQAVKRLETIVKEETAKLTLLGIEPTYPSEKYGYIIPTCKEEISLVKAFKEKPDRKKAEQYIEQGALWNAGIFAFKLGYILDKAHGMVEFTDYSDLYLKYGTLTKISFDYAVAEKESSIQVMRYFGEWKDIGTWDMVTDVMEECTKGIVALDDTCQNINVVNELNIPVICMGCKNMVVAISNNGILISDKERSSYIKPYVEKINSDNSFDKDSTGKYEVIDIFPEAMVQKVIIKKGKKIKFHGREFINEIWNIVAGTGKAIVDGDEKKIKTGDVVKIGVGCKCTIIAYTDLTLIEIQVVPNTSEEDKELDILNKAEINC